MLPSSQFPDARFGDPMLTHHYAHQQAHAQAAAQVAPKMNATGDIVQLFVALLFVGAAVKKKEPVPTWDGFFFLITELPGPCPET